MLRSASSYYFPELIVIKVASAIRNEIGSTDNSAITNFWDGMRTLLLTSTRFDDADDVGIVRAWITQITQRPLLRKKLARRVIADWALLGLVVVVEPPAPHPNSPE